MSSNPKLSKKLHRHFRLFMWPVLFIRLKLTECKTSVTAALPHCATQNEAASLRIYRKLLESKGIAVGNLAFSQRRTLTPDSPTQFTYKVLDLQPG